jgi:hypothetical protein
VHHEALRWKKIMTTPGNLDIISEQRSSADALPGELQDAVGGEAVCVSRGNDECAQVLHSLNNVLASILLNAQLVEWKLASYSRIKRNIHEIERNAQRGEELVKQLVDRFAAPTTTNRCPEPRITLDSETVNTRPAEASPRAPASPNAPAFKLKTSRIRGGVAIGELYQKPGPHTMV